MSTLTLTEATTFVLCFTPARDGIRTVTVSPRDPTELAAAVHRHARGMTGSRTVDVHLDPGQRSGSILRAGAEIARFTLNPQPGGDEQGEGQGPADDAMHGYTLDELHQLASCVVRWDRWHCASDVSDRYDAAWHAIVEDLLTAESRPTRRELLSTGQRGVDTLVRQGMQTHGYDHHNGGGRRPRFAAYWSSTAAHTPSPENRVVERQALAQIWPTLTPRQRSALTALAATGDYARAAESIGSHLKTFHVLVSQARRRFLAAWHEHESPSRPWGTDRRIGSRSRDAAPTTKRRPATRALTRRTGRPRTVPRLVHGKPATYNNHQCRCGPCTQAVADAARERGRANGAAPRRRITVSQLTTIRARAEAEPVVAIAADVGFSDTYLYRLLNGTKKPAPDPV